jgi:hypothetical protein
MGTTRLHYQGSEPWKQHSSVDDQSNVRDGTNVPERFPPSHLPLGRHRSELRHSRRLPKGASQPPAAETPLFIKLRQRRLRTLTWINGDFGLHGRRSHTLSEDPCDSSAAVRTLPPRVMRRINQWWADLLRSSPAAAQLALARTAPTRPLSRSPMVTPESKKPRRRARLSA